jgi:succinate dehydrogenase/fumarate reductase flavoprotein subunit
MADSFTNDNAHTHNDRNNLDADVLVIGGSIAGCWSALKARQQGATVILAEKDVVGRAGVVAQASGSGAYFIPGADAYNDKLTHSRHGAAEGMDNLDFVRYVFTESYKIAQELIELGFQSSVNTPNINDVRTNLLAFDGTNALGFFRDLLNKVGVTLLDYSPATQLLRNDNGHIVGATGVNTHNKQPWQVSASAVILATGGNAFRSGAMGTHHVTGDGHLLAAEAGTTFSGTEFSGHYGISPKDSATTKGFWLSSATFYDNNGKELETNGWESVHLVGKAIIETGGAYACMNKGNQAVLKVFAKGVPSIYEYFQKTGIDPFTEKFPIDLRYEGLVRSVGGIVIDDNGATNVPGLYAAGDVTERSKMTGAAMSGAGPAIAWCLVSAGIAAPHAAQYALEHTAERQRPARPIGQPQLQFGPGPALGHAEIIRTVQQEILPIEKNVFRSISHLQQAKTKLDGIWHQIKDQGIAVSEPSEHYAAREAQAMLFDARLIFHSATERLETRGLHRLLDYPDADEKQNHHHLLTGVDDIRFKKSAQVAFFNQ